jgi:bla regulator protein blaR1
MDWLTSTLIDTTAWTLFHSLWQGTAIGLIVWILLSVFQNAKPSNRHAIALSGLILFVLTTVSTFFLLVKNSQPIKQLTLAPGSSHEAATHSEYIAITPHPNSLLDALGNHVELIFLIWTIGVAFFLVKLGWQILHVQILKSNSLAPCPQEWLNLWNALQLKYNIKSKVPFHLSGLVKSPMVLGFFKPMVLFPIAAVNQLSISQTEAILLHELGHIVQKDLWINIFIAIIEALFYFNPAIWFLTNQIRKEREQRCDDVVIQYGTPPIEYASALIKIQEIKLVQNQLQLNALGNKSELLFRIKRLLGQPIKTNKMKQKVTGGIILTSLIIAFVFTTGFGEKGTLIPEFKSAQMHMMDTIPVKTSGKLTVVDKDGNRTELKLKNGEVVGATKNGKEVAPNEWPALQKQSEQIAPPLPAPPQRPPIAPAPPHAPMAPDAIRIPGPPSAPRPPVPPMPPKMGGASGIYEMDDDREMIIEDNGDVKIYKIRPNGNVIIERVAGPESMFVTADSFEILIEGLEPGAKFWRNDEEVIIDINELKLQKELLKKELGHVRGDIESFRFEFKEDELKRSREKAKRVMKLHEREMKTYNQGRKREMIVKGAPHIYVSKSGQRPNLIENAMIEDGLIDNKEEYNFRLTDKRLKVNGKKVDDSTYEKYKRLYERQTGQSLSSKFDISIKKKP